MPCGRVDGASYVRVGFVESLYQRITWLMLTAGLDAALPGLGAAARWTRVVVDSDEPVAGAPVVFDGDRWLSLCRDVEDLPVRAAVPGLGPGQRAPYDAMILERPRAGADDEFHEVLAVRKPARTVRGEGRERPVQGFLEEPREEDERILVVTRAVASLAELAEDPRSREKLRQVEKHLPPAVRMEPRDVERVLNEQGGRKAQEAFQRALDALVAEFEGFGEGAVADARRRQARRDHPARIPAEDSEFRVVLRCELGDLGVRVVDGPVVLRYARSVVHLMVYEEAAPWTAARSVRIGRAINQVVLVDEAAGVAVNVEVVEGTPRCGQILAVDRGRMTLWTVPSRAGVVPIR